MHGSRETPEPTTFPVHIQTDPHGVYEYTAEDPPQVGDIIDADDAQRRPRTIRARVIHIDSEPPHRIRAAAVTDMPPPIDPLEDAGA